ncbi:MAG: transcription termination/antitermination protein NusG [bacterium]|nr:transcription termination/antitermination protein NusG [bacterium]
MPFKWYVIHTYSGFEAKARQNLEERIKALGKSDLFGELIIPTEDVIELDRGRKKRVKRNFFPGYILVQMDLNDETYHIVRSSPRIIGFVGESRNPPPILDSEVEKIKSQMTEGALHPRMKVLFQEGETVRVIEGPFTNFQGVVGEVDVEKGRLRVLVSIFGRSTPVELDFSQVEKSG